jgi:RHS repeat-associated protein
MSTLRRPTSAARVLPLFLLLVPVLAARPAAAQRAGDDKLALPTGAPATPPSQVYGVQTDTCRNLYVMQPVCKYCPRPDGWVNSATCPPQPPSAPDAPTAFSNSPSMTLLARAEFVMRLPDGGPSAGHGSCSSCGSGMSVPEDCRVLGVSWDRIFNSRLWYPGSFGSAMMYSEFDYYLRRYPGTIDTGDFPKITFGDPNSGVLTDIFKTGPRLPWVPGDTYWYNDKHPLTVTEWTDANVTIRYKTGFTIRFEMTGYYESGSAQRGRVQWIQDRKGNRVTFAYANPAATATPDVFNWSSISDSVGRTIVPQYITWQGYNVISSATMPDGRVISYSYDASNNWNFCTGVDYGGGLQSSWNGWTYNEATQDAESYNRRLELWNANGWYFGQVKAIYRADGTFLLARSDLDDGAGNITTDIWSKGTLRRMTGTDTKALLTATFQRSDGTWEDPVSYGSPDKEPVGSVTLPDGRAWIVGRDAGNYDAPANYATTSLTDPTGATATWTYNDFGQPLSHVDFRGVREEWTYDAGGNMLTHTVAVGTPEQATRSMTWTPQGRVATRTSANGHTTTYAYYGVGEAGGRAGDLKTITTPAGPGQPAGTWTFTHDANGWVKTVTDPVGRIWTLDYDTLGRKVRTTFNDGSTEETVYGTGPFSARVLSTKDRNGNVTEMAYDPNGRVATVTVKEAVTNELMTVTTNTYDPVTGRLMSVDTDGDKVEFGYDHRGRMVARRVYPRAGLPLTETTEYVRVGNVELDLVKSTTDFFGRKTTRTYDPLDRVIAVSTELTPGGAVVTTRTEYDPEGNVTAVIRADGNRDETDYGPRGRATVRRMGRAPDAMNPGQWLPALATESYAYDADSNLTVRTDARGFNWVTDYTVTDAVLSTTDPSGKTASNTYYPDGKRATSTDERGNTTTYVWDTCCGGAGTERLRQIVHPDGTMDQFSYDPNGNRVEAVDASGRRRTRTYDGLNRVVTSVNGAGGVALTTRIAFNRTPGAIGRIVTVTSPAGRVTVRDLDGLGAVLAVSGDTPALSFSDYAVAGGYRKRSVTDANGNTSHTLEDGAGRTYQSFDGLGAAETYFHDGEGRLTSAVDRDGSITLKSYDAMGRNVVTIRNANPGGVSQTVTADYYPTGQVLRLTDAEGNKTEYALDPNGREASATYAAGTPQAKTWSRTYHENGLLKTLVKPAGTISFVYDVKNRPIVRAYSTGGADFLAWHDNGWRKQVRRTGVYAAQWGDIVVDTSDLANDYDEAGRLLRERQYAGEVVMSYDADGLLLSHNYPSGVAGSLAGYTYTNRGELHQAKLDGAVVSTFAWDPAGRRNTRTDANGNVTSWTFDAADRLTGIANPIQSYSFLLTPGGDIKARKDLTAVGLSWAFGYDGLHRLTDSKRGVPDMAGGVPAPDFAQSWILSANGNHAVTTTNGVPAAGDFGPHNEQTGRSDVAAAFTHDADLNLSFDGTFRYAYNLLDELDEVRDAANSLVQQTLRDALGRSVWVSDPDNGNGGWKVAYVGMRDVEWYDGGNDWAITHLYGTFVDERVARTSNTDGGYGTQWLSHDQVFSTTVLADESGAAVERYRYTAYGVLTTTDGNGNNPLPASRFRNRATFTGRTLNPETGIYDFRRRHYQSRLGSFLQRDPLGYVDSPSLYSYVANNPLTSVDPSGTLLSVPVDLKCSDKCGPDITDWFRADIKAHLAFADENTSLFSFRYQAADLMSHKWINFSSGNAGCGTGKCVNTVMLDGVCLRKNQVGNIMFGIVATFHQPAPYKTAFDVMKVGYNIGGSGGKYVRGAGKGMQRSDNLAAFGVGRAIGKGLSSNRAIADSLTDPSAIQRYFKRLYPNYSGGGNVDTLTYIPEFGGFNTRSCQSCGQTFKANWTSIDAGKQIIDTWRSSVEWSVIEVPQELPREPVPSETLDAWRVRMYENYEESGGHVFK